MLNTQVRESTVRRENQSPHPAGEEEPQEASGGIVSRNRRTEFNIQAYAPQQLVMEIRDTKEQPDL
jgi:hypothetical protein